KIKNTKELKTLPREERQGEIKDSFSASLNAGDRVCIVDDVTASGATLSEMASALKNAGASYACAVVVAVYLHS
ncbi:MAG: phosphoribosyltransferase, partial [Endomicrobia bacterium]|nr:phosphoribosyltransferase [Endomicrobiia bacterium]